MPTVPSLIVAALSLVAPSLTSPTTPTLQKRSFRVEQTQNENQRVDGAWALRQAYLKHGIPLPDSLVKRQAPVPVGSAPIPKLTADVIAVSESNDLEYLSPVEIGNNVMKLDFDTGSSDLWVFSDRLPEYQKKNHNFYLTLPPTNTTMSAGAIRQVTGTEKKGFTWKVTYGDGTGASGVVFEDKVRIGPVIAKAQAVEAATQISPQFHQEQSDGLMGLGFGKTNTVRPDRQKTWFENVKDQLQEPLFTVALKKNATGSYDFGFIDKKKYTGDIQYAPVNSTRGYWEYHATGYQVADGAPVQTPFQSIADTGTTLLLLPPVAVKDFYTKVPKAALVAKEGGYVYPCESATKMPDLHLFVARTAGPVTPGSPAAVSSTDPIKLTVPGRFLDRGKSMTGSGLCYGGVQSGSPNLSIWGDIFLKSQFVVFEGSEPPRIGFAKQAPEVVNSAGTKLESLMPPRPTRKVRWASR